ncbi:MAG TPA: hypothetical protein H9837_10105 [Candidatus Brachybacterium merdigallinarum]|nr:hypothetical protein [Candidatus Brachybacterium merdigallinarum]
MFGTHRRRRKIRRNRPGDRSALPPFRLWQLLTRTVFFHDTTAPDGTPVQFAVDVRYLANELEGEKKAAPDDIAVTGDVGPEPLTPPEGDDAEQPGSRSALTDWLGSWDDWFGPSTSDAEASGAEEGAGSGTGSSSKRSQRPQAALYRDGVQVARANFPAVFPVPDGAIEVATGTYGLTRMHLVPEQGPARALRPHPRTMEGRRSRFGQRHPALSRLLGVVAVLVLLISLAVTVPQIVEQVTTLEPVAERVGTFTSPISLPAWANTSLLVIGALAAFERALTLRNHWLIDADTTWTNFT